MVARVLALTSPSQSSEFDQRRQVSCRCRCRCRRLRDRTVIRSTQTSFEAVVTPEMIDSNPSYRSSHFPPDGPNRPQRAAHSLQSTLRRDWYFGAEAFREKLLASLGKGTESMSERRRKGLVGQEGVRKEF